MQTPQTNYKNRWITEEILNMMEHRRLAKDNNTEYNRFKNNIKKIIKNAKKR